MIKKRNEAKEILFRYLIGVVIAAITFFFPLFYIVFRPLTVWPTFFILGFFYDITLRGTETIIIGNFNIEIIDACIAGSAYSLLFLLNILTREMSLKKRTIVFIFDSGLLLLLNILRLFILTLLLVSGSSMFDFTHKAFWYLLSTAFVIGIWFLSVWLFKIRATPFYSDVQFLLKKKIKHR